MRSDCAEYYEMSGLKVPVLSIIIGEGGGVLAMAAADEVWILENAIYSFFPEEFAGAPAQKTE